MAKHALLSASGAHRWLLCTPSAQLEQKFPASTSAYAEEGTVAHALAELTTRYFLGELDEVSYENQIKSEFEPNSYYNAEMRECAVAYGNEFVPYVVLTEKMLNKIQACTYSMDIFNQVAKMTTNYRVWEKVTDYLVQCSDIIADKVENAKAQG